MEAARDVPSEASRPVRSDPGRGRPLPVPAGFDGQCSRARAPISWVVVAHSMPGRRRVLCFYCSLKLCAKCVGRFPCTLARSVQPLHFAGSPLARFDY